MKQKLIDILHFLKNGEFPGQLVIQITDRCNASCPQCGMRVTESFKRTSLSSREIYQILEDASRKRFQAVSFTGGEPFLDMERLIDLIDYAGKLGIPYIRTGTNGFIFRNPNRPDFEKKISNIAQALSKTNVRNVWISIDSSIPYVHEEMRGFEGVVEGIKRALPLFHENGIYPSANLGINRNIGGSLTRDLNRKDFETHQFNFSFHLINHPVWSNNLNLIPK